MPGSPTSILYPVFAQALLTFAVLLQIPIARFRAVAEGKVTAEDFRLGESERVPPETRLPNRNYMNLLEAPLLFYLACVGMYVTQVNDEALVIIAWAYVCLRAVHSFIHLTYNRVLHRLAAFALSNFVLATLWIRFFMLLKE